MSISNSAKSAIGFVASFFSVDSFTLGSARRSLSRNTSASADHLKELAEGVVNNMRNTMQVEARHEAFGEACARLNLDKKQLAHVHQHALRMQHIAIVLFGFSVVILSCHLGAFVAGGRVVNLVTTGWSCGLVALAYAYAIKFSLRRWQIEQRQLCGVRHYLSHVGFFHPLSW